VTTDAEKTHIVAIRLCGYYLVQKSICCVKIMVEAQKEYGDDVPDVAASQQDSR
jgi:hypothetical protein